MKGLFIALLLALVLSLAFTIETPVKHKHKGKRSSHSEAPGTTAIPNADITDLYAFRSYESGRENYVTFLINTYPLQTPYGGPNYFSLSTEHFYELYIDNTYDGIEDVSFQWIYGNSLPVSGPQGKAYVFGTDFQCQPSYSQNNTPALTPNSISTGIALNIGGNSVAIALKVAGLILGSSGSLNNLNWEEYYSLNYLSGPLATATSTPLGAGGQTVFDKPFDYAGENSFSTASDYESYAMGYIVDISLNGVATCPTGSQGKVWVGQRSDPFWISLGRIFDYLNFIPVAQIPAFAAYTIKDCVTNNDLREKNVATFALEIPISCVANISNSAQSIIYLWAGTRDLYHAPNDTLGTSSHIAGPQVSRMGNPLVNELVIGLIDKNRFSRQHPIYDANPAFGFGTYVFYPTFPEIISGRYLAAVNQILGTAFASLAPTTPRNDLVATFLTGIAGINKAPGNFIGEVMRLNLALNPIPIGSQNSLGIVGAVLQGNLTDLAGYPNGRRPGDDVVDISLDVMMGVECLIQFADVLGFNLCVNGWVAPIAGVYLTDGSPVDSSFYLATFPYFTTPTPGSYLDGAAGNVVQTATICYPGGQHGRCPICGNGTQASASASHVATTTGGGFTCPSSAGRVESFFWNLFKF